jgi:hypothetical protein
MESLILFSIMRRGTRKVEKLINKERTFHMLSYTIYLLIDLTIITFFMPEQTEKGSHFISGKSVGPKQNQRL